MRWTRCQRIANEEKDTVKDTALKSDITEQIVIFLLHRTLYGVVVVRT